MRKNQKSKILILIGSIIKFVKRSEEDNTHESIVDQAINQISCFKINNKIYRCVNRLFCGILNNLLNFQKGIFIKYLYDPCEINEAEYCLIKDHDGIVSICEVKKENFFKKTLSKLNFSITKKDLINSIYKGREYDNLSDTNIVIF